ncbi:MAG: glycosyltransferase, partial [Gemmatimonadales bacterium]
MADALRCGGVLVTVLLVEEAGDRAVNDDVASGVVRLNLRWVVPLSRLLPGVVEGWQLLGAVRRLDRQHHFAVIEGPNVAGICWAVALWFPRRFLLRAHTSVVTVRGDAAVRSTFRQRFKQWLDRFATRSARMVVTHSKTHAATIADEYGLREASITIVPHAVPDPGAVSSGDPGRILAIANATRRKGVDVLLRAFAQVIGSAPDTELV